MKPAIRVQNVSKLYQIGQQQGYQTLRESIMSSMAAPWKKIQRLWQPAAKPTGKTRLEGNHFWALKDLEFEVQPGEVIGVIGRNGAGKSTLLKILSNITQPTSGRIEIRGRIGSLLEVGTGFHHELTGRENIYMNGSILGMSKREIDRKFDEIVAFSEIAEFLDTPVKRYSSGMYVRLAFAVAAHLEPDILIVDEVLAVGDQTFQRRCLDRIRMLRNSGRTVLVVSHNLSTISELCTSGILLHDGRLVCQGTAADVVAEYGKQARARNQLAQQGTADSERASPNIIQEAFFFNSDNESSHLVNLGDTLRGIIVLSCRTPLPQAKLILGINRLGAERMFTLISPIGPIQVDSETGYGLVEFEVPNSPLAAGDYSLKVVLENDGVQVEVRDPAVTFTVADMHSLLQPNSYKPAFCHVSTKWNMNYHLEGKLSQEII